MRCRLRGALRLRHVRCMGERGLERKCKFEDRSLLQSRINDKTMKRIRGQASIFKYGSTFSVALLLYCGPPPTFPVEQPIDLLPIRSTAIPFVYRPGQVVNGPVT